jgi:NADPH:quinone reductase-like Zn-dependent oxidoreductase
VQKSWRNSKPWAPITSNYKENADWGQIARDFTCGRGVDHVIEIGGPGTLEQSMKAVRVGGHVSLIGILTGLKSELPVVVALIKQIQLRAVLVGSRRQQRDMIRAIDANGMKPVIDRSFALEEIVEAFKYQESKRHFGKICLEF